MLEYISGLELMWCLCIYLTLAASKKWEITTLKWQNFVQGGGRKTLIFSRITVYYEFLHPFGRLNLFIKYILIINFNKFIDYIYYTVIIYIILTSFS